MGPKPKTLPGRKQKRYCLTQYSETFLLTILNYVLSNVPNEIHTIVVGELISKLKASNFQREATLLESFYKKLLDKAELLFPFKAHVEILDNARALQFLSEPYFFDSYVIFKAESLVIDRIFRIPKGTENLIHKYLAHAGVTKYRIKHHYLITPYPLPKRLLLPSNPPYLLEFHGTELSINVRTIEKNEVKYSIEINPKEELPYVEIKPLRAPPISRELLVPREILLKTRAENFTCKEIKAFARLLEELKARKFYTDQVRIYDHVKHVKPGQIIEIVGEKGIGKTSAILAGALGRKTLYLYYDKDKKRIVIKNPLIFDKNAFKDKSLRKVLEIRSIPELLDTLRNLSSDTLLVLDDIYYLYEDNPRLAIEILHVVLSLDRLPRIVVGDESLETRIYQDLELRNLRLYFRMRDELSTLYINNRVNYSVALRMLASMYPNENPARLRLLALGLIRRTFREAVTLLRDIKNYTIRFDPYLRIFELEKDDLENA